MHSQNICTELNPDLLHLLSRCGLRINQNYSNNPKSNYVLFSLTLLWSRFHVNKFRRMKCIQLPSWLSSIHNAFTFMSIEFIEDIGSQCTSQIINRKFVVYERRMCWFSFMWKRVRGARVCSPATTYIPLLRTWTFERNTSYRMRFEVQQTNIETK